MATLVVPKSALRMLEMTLAILTVRANADGEVFGNQIADAMAEAGTRLGIDRLEVLLVRTVLVRTMESLGESYPAELLQNHEVRIPLSDAVKYLRGAIESTTRLQENTEAPVSDHDSTELNNEERHKNVYQNGLTR